MYTNATPCYLNKQVCDLVLQRFRGFLALLTRKFKIATEGQIRKLEEIV